MAANTKAASNSDLALSAPKAKQKKGNTFLKEVNRSKTLILMCVPAILFFLVFSYLPMPGLWLAFTQFNYAQGIFGSPFVGLTNFEFLVRSGDLWVITRNTVLYNVAFIILGNAIAVTFAIMLNEIASKLFRKISQSIMFLPHFMSHVIIGLMVFGLVNFDFGLINSVRESLGFDRFFFFGTPRIWPFIITGTHLWQTAGFNSIVYFAVITGMDSEVMEAAAVDGATSWKRILYIILPNLKGTFVILLLFAMGGILRGNFGLFFNLVGTSNFNLFAYTDIIEMYVFRSLMTNFNFGLAAAASFYQSVFGFAIVLFANWVVRKLEPDYALF
ncbi:MAG: ABC transporter permease subunit [Defluviitaleaceae bacterium]|nr:ABC transporter permease subunit [Defluviitaleaceae bacterium]